MTSKISPVGIHSSRDAGRGPGELPPVTGQRRAKKARPARGSRDNLFIFANASCLEAKGARARIASPGSRELAGLTIYQLTSPIY
jgi:hypothetical protein